MRLTRVPLLIVLTALALPATARAQRLWYDDQGKDAFRLDFGYPFLKGDGHKFFTGTIVPSLSRRAGEGFRIEADIPIARAANDDESSLRLGNPLLGLRIGQDDHPVTGILHVRLPFARESDDAIDQEALSAGGIANFDEVEAYSANLLTLRGGLEYHKVRANGLMFGARGAPSLQMNMSGDPGKDTEVFFDYGARFGYEGAGALATLALTGRYLITAPHNQFTCDPGDEDCDPKGFNERTFHAATATLELRRGRVRPRVAIRVPFDKLIRDQSSASLHLGVSLVR